MIKGILCNFRKTILVCIGMSAPSLAQAADLENLSREVLPSICTVITEDSEGSSQGSCFVVSDGYHIATNYHVIEGARQISIDFENQPRRAAVLVINDPENDLAVLRLRTSRPLRTLPLCSVRGMVGAGVASYGNPQGLGLALQGEGHISRQEEVLIIHNAGISSGSSGGPLIHIRERCVIGINTASLTPPGIVQNLNVAVEVTLLRNLIRQIGLSLSDSRQRQQNINMSPERSISVSSTAGSFITAGREAMAEGDYRSARFAFLEAVAIEPQNPEANHGLAFAAHRQNDIPFAMRYYCRALSLTQANSALAVDILSALESLHLECDG